MRQRRHGHVRQRSAGTWEIHYTRGTDRHRQNDEESDIVKVR